MNLFSDRNPGLRVRARISWHFGASAGRADARRRDAGDVVTSSRIPSGARDAPRRAAVPMHADYYSLMIMFLLRMGTAAKCQVILARALSSGLSGNDRFATRPRIISANRMASSLLELRITTHSSS